MNDLMIDLETFGSTPGCALVSIGATLFDSKGVGSVGFYQVVNLSSCESLGLHVDPDTMKWWRMQSHTAREALDLSIAGAGVDIGTAMVNLRNYIERFSNVEDVKVWGNGADFDNAILAVVAYKLRMKLPWTYPHNRCFRTLARLNPDVRRPERVGTHHNALDDATFQALHASMIFAKLENAGA